MWQFTIIDYTGTAPQSTPIQEPIGWDAVNLHLKRDETGHGFFGFEDDTFSSLQYDGNGAAVLRAAYYNHGIKANVQLAVAYNCDGEDPDNNLYLGTFDFTTFKDYTADRCYVECATLVSQAYYLFKNRKDQQVDLDSLASFDQLPVTQTVNCQAVFSQSYQQIRVGVLLNGLLPGSKITITGSVSNNSTYTVASAKPDYTNVNPDGNFAYAISSVTVSATFNAGNKTLSINQLLNIDAGAQITVNAAQFPSVPGRHYDNSGTYQVLSVQQFFNYTVLNIGAISITDSTADNYPNRMADLSADAVILTPASGNFNVTSEPTSTIIQVIETMHNEDAALVGITGMWQQNNLTAYSSLSKIITLPAKQIYATSKWLAPQQKIYELADNGVGSRQNPFVMIITPDWPNVQSDIDETDVADGVPIWDPNPANAPDTILYFRQQSLACQGTGTLNLNVSGRFIDSAQNNNPPWVISSNELTTGTPGFTDNSVRLVVIKDTTWQGIGAYSSTSPQVLLDWQIAFNSSAISQFSFPWQINNINFEPGEYVWIFFHFVVNFQPFANSAPQLVLDAQSYFEFTLGSICEDTPCSVYLVNEALSRCTESYTNGQIQVYSDYFGRTNAQPVASPADGCGALACVTNGLRVRGCVMPDGSAIPKFFTSLNDMFTALDAIHNIGMGMEADPNRPGMLRLRIEPFEWFFPGTYTLGNNTVLTGVMNYTREVQTSLLCSTFKCGYQQFETWNNNGLYDIFGDRKYRTPLNHLENEIDKTCKWMASDYAIEFARRQFGVTTSDGRYDDATFILCLQRQNVQPVTFLGRLNTLVLGYNNLLNPLLAGSLWSYSTVSISGAANAANNGTFNVYGFSMGDYAIITFYAGGDFVNEYAADLGITFNFADSGGGISGGPVFANAMGVFVSQLGGMMMTEPLFGAGVNDVLAISGTGSNNGNFTIKQIIQPAPAYGSVLPTPTPAFTSFPQFVFATTLFAPEVAANCVISDTTTPIYTVEQGMDSGTNILSPSTVMNYRISPAHAAMRHYRNIITDRQYANENLIFTGGAGNFYALGQMTDSCSPENGNISEGGNLSLANFTAPDDGKPLFYPEIIKFEYPLTWAQFLQIQANPYGLIQFEHANDGVQQGWLTDLQYHPYTGLAEFTLYPKI